jgi:hypothetical protein
VGTKEQVGRDSVVNRAAEVVKTMQGGREVWHIRSGDGQVRVLVTSSTSAESMDRAMVTYESALRRLANR